MVGGKKAGPLTRVELGVEAATGRINSQNQVWKEGMEEWCAAGDIPDLAPLFTRKKKEFIPSSQKRAPPPKKNENGAGTNDFDTAHFRLAELPPEDKATSRQMEFDTSHFRLAELKREETGLNRNTEFDTAHFRLADMAPEDSGQNRNLEFDTAHFRLADMGQQPQQDAPKRRFRVAPRAEAKPVLPPGKIKQASTAAAPAEPPAAEKPEWNPNSTVVDFRTLGELVHQQDVAQDLFESELSPAPQKAREAHAADIFRYAAAEMAKEEKDAKQTPHPPAAPKRDLPPPPIPLSRTTASESAPFIWPSVAIGAILAAALALLLLWD